LDEIFAYLLKNKKTKVEDLIQSFSCKTLYLHGLIAFLASQTVNNQRLILCEKEDKTNSVVIYLNEKLYSILDGITLTLAAEDNSVFYKLFEKR
ncbi:hypothetical protein ACI3PL_20200, partial [Lacticaseibacillus paracasei]